MVVDWAAAVSGGGSAAAAEATATDVEAAASVESPVLTTVSNPTRGLFGLLSNVFAGVTSLGCGFTNSPTVELSSLSAAAAASASASSLEAGEGCRAAGF